MSRQELRDETVSTIQRYLRPPQPRRDRSVVWLAFNIAVAIAVILAVLVLLGLSSAMGQEPEGLPVVTEHYDAIVIVQPKNSTNDVIVFVRGGKVFATRWRTDDMLWGRDAKGRPFLAWQDYWSCDRVITTDSLVVMQCDEDWTHEGQNGPWFCQNRRMVDLAEPGR